MANGLAEYNYWVPPGYTDGTPQENSAHVYYAGGWDLWRHVYENGTSGGYHAYVGNKSGAKILVPYEGRCITRVYTAASNRGVVEWRLDGVVRGTYDERAVNIHRQMRREFCASAHGKHTIEFKIITNDILDADQFLVDRTFAVAAAQVGAAGQSESGVTYQENDEAVHYVGDWHSFAAEDASNGSLSFTQNQWDAVVFSFEGTGVEWCYSKAPNRGKASILIDGEDGGVVDLYSSEVERNQCWVSPELEPGLHHLHIAAMGEKHKDSSGMLIDVDHFIVR